ncbi:hypothetical protein JW824_11040 [bacterium]|nr:hypothetical protein [bacterium]
MNDFTFRLSVRLPNDVRLEIPSPHLNLSGPYHGSLDLASTGEESEYLILKGSGHETEEDAWKAGQLFRDVFTLALSANQIGANFGDRAATKGAFTRTGLVMLGEKQGRSVMNDVLGLTIFETSFEPLFASFKGNVVIGKNPKRFEELFKQAASKRLVLDDRERLAFDLFSSSFFEPSQDARFMLLVSSIEVILDPKPRSETSQEHVNQLIDATINNTALNSGERKSLLGVLNWLSKESIGQAGRRLAKERLDGREYGGMNASSFFSMVYEVRSRLVHGADPFPSIKEVTKILTPLQAFVADMIWVPHFGSAI